jgi:hypothetical protein
VGKCDECAAPCYRHAPIVGAYVGGSRGVVGINVCSVRLAGEAIAGVEHVEGCEPIWRGRSGLAGKGEGGVLGYDVTEEE